jgi:hypothetical protein
MYICLGLPNRVPIEQEANRNPFIYFFIFYFIYNLPGFSFVFQIKYLSFIQQGTIRQILRKGKLMF